MIDDVFLSENDLRFFRIKLINEFGFGRYKVYGSDIGDRYILDQTVLPDVYCVVCKYNVEDIIKKTKKFKGK